MNEEETTDEKKKENAATEPEEKEPEVISCGSYEVLFWLAMFFVHLRVIKKNVKLQYGNPLLEVKMLENLQLNNLLISLIVLPISVMGGSVNGSVPVFLLWVGTISFAWVGLITCQFFCRLFFAFYKQSRSQT